MTSKISSVNWEFTKKCNLNCLHCIGNYGIEDSKELTLPQQIKAVDKLVELGCESISFTGGEPLCSDTFREIVYYSCRKGLDVSLITNSILLDPRDAFYKKFKSIGISIDDDFIRGDGSTTSTLSKIKELIENDFNVSAYISVYHKNINQLENLIKTLNGFGVENFGIKNIRINDIVLRGRAENNKSVFKSNKKEMQDILQKTKSILLTCSNDEELIEYTLCDVDYKNIFLDSTGRIFGCTEIYQMMPDLSICNILDFDSQKIRQYQDNDYSCFDCCYTMYVNSKFTLCFCNGNNCPLSSNRTGVNL